MTLKEAPFSCGFIFKPDSPWHPEAPPGRTIGLGASGGPGEWDFCANVLVCFSSAPQARNALRVKRASLKTRYLGL